MKLAFRSLFFGCLAMLAAAVSFALPASAATERILPAYELTAPDLVVFHLIAMPEVSVIVERRSEQQRSHAASSIDPGPIAPVYLRL